jgi:hypothetical protein
MGGTWTSAANSAYSGGAMKYSRGAGSGFNASFNGTGIDWIAYKGLGYGKALVTVDGGATETVDLYAAGNQFKAIAWGKHGLPNGLHTIRVDWLGDKNALANDDRINLDALDVEGAPAQAPAYSTAVRYEETDAAISYESTWTPYTNAAYSGGSMTYTKGAGSAATIAFSGTGIDLVAYMGPAYGEALVTLDGSTTRTVDFYAPTNAFKQVVWATHGLENGLHTVRLEWTGGHNPSATDTRIDLDAVDIEGTITQR